MAVGPIQNFLNGLSKNQNVQNVVNEFQRLSSELAKKGHDLRTSLAEGGEKNLEEARKQMLHMAKAVADTRKQLDREVEQAMSRIRASADQVEKGLEDYRTKALKQRDLLEKMLRERIAQAKKAAKGGKKASTKARTKAKAAAKSATGKAKKTVKVAKKQATARAKTLKTK